MGGVGISAGIAGEICPGPGWPKIVYQNRGVFGFWHLICHCGAASGGCKFAYEPAGAETRFYGPRAQSHAEGHVNLKMPAFMTRERSSAGGVSALNMSHDQFQTRRRLGQHPSPAGRFQGELSIPMQVLINLLDGVFLYYLASESQHEPQT